MGILAIFVAIPILINTLLRRYLSLFRFHWLLAIAVVGLLVGALQLFEKVFAALAKCWCHLRQPDGGLRRFDLAVKGPDALELVVAPVLQQPGRLR